MALGEIAKAVGMPASKAHRYLVSLCRGGLLKQDLVTGRYDLSRAAIRFGLAALSRLDEFKLAGPVLLKVHEDIGAPVSATVWSENGPVAVLREETVHPLVIATRLGAVLSVVNSASGRVFAAHLPGRVVDGLIASEFSRGVRPTNEGRPMTNAQFRDLLANVREKGVASTHGSILPGLNSLAAPVFDANGKLVMALTMLSIAGALDFSEDGQCATVLRDAARDLSDQLGYPAPHGSPG
jgi:DNA-binding IclR family transcriptional regulator